MLEDKNKDTYSSEEEGEGDYYEEEGMIISSIFGDVA